MHCSDGWDRTPQLTSLSMLMLDAYYRTIEGFIVLIEKEWLSFGHKFAHRLGWTVGGHCDSSERSPVFIQWLDCVHQCVRQRPEDFEFNESLLLFIAQNLYTGKYGTFMFNNEREKVTSLAKYHMLSIWTSVLAYQSEYTNPLYKKNPGISTPVLLKPLIVVWDAFFTSFSSRLYNAAWLSNYNEGKVEEEYIYRLNRQSSTADEPSQMAHLGDNEDLTEGSSASNMFRLFKQSTGTGTMSALSPIKGADTKVSTEGVKWVRDFTVNSCSRCNTHFSSFKRRHHCRNCGLIYCGACSNQKRFLDSGSSWNSRKRRVCIECALKIDKIKAKDLSSPALRQREMKRVTPQCQLRPKRLATVWC